MTRRRTNSFATKAESAATIPGCGTPSTGSTALPGLCCFGPPAVARNPTMKPRRIIANTTAAAIAKRISPSRMNITSINKTRSTGSRMNIAIPAVAMRMLGRSARLCVPKRESISASADPNPIAAEANQVPYRRRAARSCSSRLAWFISLPDVCRKLQAASGCPAPPGESRTGAEVWRWGRSRGCVPLQSHPRRNRMQPVRRSP